MMNYDNSPKAKYARVVNRYGKTVKGNAKTVKTKVKVKPTLGKNKIGFKIKATF